VLQKDACLCIVVLHFCISVILNIEGVKILIDAKKYESGKFEVVEFTSGPSASGTEPTIHAVGYIDEIKTDLLIGTIGHHHTDSIIRLPKEPPIYLPVWYKPDRKLTLDRYKGEHEFLFWRVSKNLLKYFIIFNCWCPTKVSSI